MTKEGDNMKTIKDIENIRNQNVDIVEFRDNKLTKEERIAKNIKYKHTVLICGGTGCTSNHSGEIYEKFVAGVKAKGIEDRPLQGWPFRRSHLRC